MANGIEPNYSQFAEGVLGISRQRFHAWLYKELKDVEAKPLQKCVEALNTNANYLLGLTDDPRPEFALQYREAQLVEAFRVLSATDQEKLLKNANDWVAMSDSARSVSAPYPFPPKGNR